MIHSLRSKDSLVTCTLINFRGYVISIAMDDRSRGGNAPLTRTSLAVFKEDAQDVPVTKKFAGNAKVEDGYINECEADTLFHVMGSIAASVSWKAAAIPVQ